MAVIGVVGVENGLIALRIQAPLMYTLNSYPSCAAKTLQALRLKCRCTRLHTRFDGTKITLTGLIGYVFDTAKQAGLEAFIFMLTAG